MENSLIRVSKPPLFSFREILWFLDRNYDDCLFHVTDYGVRRLVRSDTFESLLEVTESREDLCIRVLDGNGMPSDLVIDYVVRWFDMERDIRPFYDLLEPSKLSYMVNEYNGLRLIGIPDLFEALCWCVIGQQINLNFAHTIKRRLVEAYGTPVKYEGQLYYSFPTPELLAGQTMGELRSMQFSRQKADYILGLAKFFVAHPDFQHELGLLPPTARYRKLVSLRGVGEWTANYVLMKTFGQVDSIPHGDSGLFKALENHDVIRSRSDRKTIDRFFSQFPGWASYLTIYLWRSLK